MDGKHYKMDQTRLDFNKDDFMQPHWFRTQRTNFPDHGCDLVFESKGLSYDGLYAVFLGFQQYLMFGEYSGVCEVEGRVFKIDKVFGAVEHVRARF